VTSFEPVNDTWDQVSVSSPALTRITDLFAEPSAK
jgi:hypothetical protein